VANNSVYSGLKFVERERALSFDLPGLNWDVTEAEAEVDMETEPDAEGEGDLLDPVRETELYK